MVNTGIDSPVANVSCMKSMMTSARRWLYQGNRLAVGRD